MQVHVVHPKGIMVWLAISANGVTKPFFVKPGAKINWRYYINKVLRPFLKEAKRLYPDNNFIFHQDSAPHHTAKTTLEFLKSNKIVLTPGLPPFAGAKTGQKKYKGPPFDIFEIYFYSILR